MEAKSFQLPLTSQDLTTVREFRTFLKVRKPVLLPVYNNLSLESQFIVAETYWRMVFEENEKRSEKK